jgi:hypothetical protein
MQTNEAIALWKELGITTANMEFSCGGDSMNDYHFSFYNSENKEVQSGELESFFDDDVFKRVEFYVNSDGHYIGESGNVSIELSEDEENPDFVYYKNAQAEWSESFTDEVAVELTEKEVEFVRSKVLNLVGSQDGNAINYKGDCILNNEEEQISDTISQKISDVVMNHEFENAEGEEEEWFQYNTDEVDSDVLPKIVGNTLFVSLTKQFLVYTDSEL